MICYLRFVAIACALAFTTPAFGYQYQSVAEPAPTLGIGSTAPQLDISNWFSRGPENKYPIVNKFESGKVYIVEFWATWCPPCIASMPHLSALQDKYPNSLQIISISGEQPEAVENFLLRKVRSDPSMTYAQLTKNYCLTADPDQSSEASYMQASGAEGIPTAFLIGKTGKIEWMGHPLEVDEPLELVLANKFDALAYQKVTLERERREAKLEAEVEEVLVLLDGGQTNQALAKLDTIILGADGEIRRSLEFTKVEILSSVGRPALAIKQLNKMIGNASGDELTELKLLKFQIMALESIPGAEKLFFEIAEMAKDPLMQNSAAWSVVQMNMEGGAVSPKMLAKARSLADAAVAAVPAPSVLETQAHLIFMQGNVDQAIAIQKRAIAGARERSLLKRLKFFLGKWQANSTSQKVETKFGERMPAPLR